MHELPLFPLPDTVVFPGMTIPLFVFEERYKCLVRRCVESDDHRFVIALARSSGPVSDGVAAVHPLGTFMDILSVTENADGTYNILTHGQGRCRVAIAREEAIQDADGHRRPLFYIDDLPDPLGRGDPNEERVAAWDALDTFRSYAETILPFDAEEQIERALPDDLLHQASFICANMRVPSESRQILLEAETLELRFHLARKLMEERIEAHRASGPT